MNYTIPVSVSGETAYFSRAVPEFYLDMPSKDSAEKFAEHMIKQINPNITFVSCYAFKYYPNEIKDIKE